VQLAADPAFKLQGAASEQQDLAPWGDRKPVLVLDLDRSEKPQGYFLPLDEISPLYGKSWREIGLDGFANHRTQGITGCLAPGAADCAQTRRWRRAGSAALATARVTWCALAKWEYGRGSAHAGGLHSPLVAAGVTQLAAE
jgi:hypothetical protein